MLFRGAPLWWFTTYIFFIVVQVTDELPPPAAGEVQVAVKAVGLNFADGTPSYKQVQTPIPNHSSLSLESYL